MLARIAVVAWVLNSIAVRGVEGSHPFVEGFSFIGRGMAELGVVSIVAITGQ